MSEAGQELVVIPAEDALTIFTDKARMEPYIEKVRKAVADFAGTVTTAKGRKEIASMAHKVVKVKTYIEGVGFDLATAQKEIPKKIDATRKYVRDTLDKIAGDVRQPLTTWEKNEEARVKKHTDTLALLDTFTRGEYPQTIDAIKANIATAAAIIIGPACEEFEPEYDKAKESAEAALTAALARAEQAEADRAELERLRTEAAERAENDRIEKLKRDAAEQAKQEAEQAAQAERDAAQAREDELRRAAEKAQQDARDTEERLKREAAAKAAQDERDRLAREANTKHRAAVNRAALSAFVEGGVDEATAKKVIALIAKKMIPAISITY
jgi:septal ring factor EnvC (AmiA/AmiB activator)